MEISNALEASAREKEKTLGIRYQHFIDPVAG